MFLGTQLLYALGHLVDHLGEFDSLCSRDPGKLDPAFLDAEIFKEPLQGCGLSSAHIVAAQVMTVARVATGYEDAVDPVSQCLEDKEGIDPPGTGNPDHPDVRGILDPRCPRKVCPGVRTPVAKESKNLRLPVVQSAASKIRNSNIEIRNKSKVSMTKSSKHHLSTRFEF